AKPGDFTRERLYQAGSAEGVAQISPMHVQLSPWRNPSTGQYRGMLTMGVDPAQPVFTLPEIRDQMRQLVHPEHLLIDRRSRSEFGPRDGRSYGDQDLGGTTELGGQPIRIAGHFELGAGLAADGAAVVGDRAFARLFPM